MSATKATPQESCSKAGL